MNPTIGPLLLGVLLPGAPALKDRVGTDLAEIQGAWRMEACTYHGTAVPADVLAGAVVEVRAGRLSFVRAPVMAVRAGGAVAFDLRPGADFRFTLDPAARPGGIDLRLETKDGATVFAGIYRLDGDRLRLCYVFGDARPTGFRSDDQPRALLFDLRRVKP